MYMTSVNTQRIHLNTNDAELVDGNHANATFNLAKANLQCLCNQELSISLVKAVLPITIDAFGYNDDDTVAFTMKIIDSSFTDQILKCFITKDTYDIPPYAATRPTVFKFPVSYLESPLSIQDILNKILASQYSGSSNISLIILKDSKRTAVQFDSGTITELVFDNSYVVKGRVNYNKPAQRLFTALGINTYDGEDVGGLVPTETIFKGGNGGIDNGTNVFFQYQLSLYHPPINLVSNLMLDSASSNGGGAKNNILAGIQIDVEDQSREMECTHIGGGGTPDPDPDPEPNPIFFGVPHDHQASGIFPSDPTISYFFYYDGTVNKVYKHDSTSNTTTIHDIGTGANQLFPNLPTNQAMDRAVYSSNGSMYIKWENPSGVYQQLQFTDATTYTGSTTSTPSDNNKHDARTANSSYAIAISSTQMIVRLPNNGWATDHQFNQGSWGGTTTPYTGLPQTGHRSINMIPGNNNQILVFYDTGLVYTIDLSSQTVVSSAQYGSVAPEPNPIFFGVPHDHQASGLFPSDPTISYFFYYDGTVNKVYKHDSTSNTTTIHDIGTGANQLFPGLPTNQAMDRALFTQNVLFVKWKPPTGSYRQMRYTNSTTASGGQVSSPSDVDQQAATFNNSYSVLINSANTFAVQLPQSGFAMDHSYTTGNWGGTTTPYTGLPQTGHRSMAMLIGFNGMVQVFYDTGIVYTIDLSSQTVVASAPYGSVASVASVSSSVSSSVTGSTILVSKSSSLINHINHSVGNSHKIVSANSVSNLTLILENDSGGEKYSDSNIYYEIEFKTYDSLA